MGKKDSGRKKENKLNIYLDSKDKHSLEVIKLAIDEYSKGKFKIKIDITNSRKQYKERYIRKKNGSNNNKS